jgi:hypothetical protein
MTWQFSYVPKEGVTITYSIEPLQPGTWPTSAGAQAVFEDSSGQLGAASFPVPSVVVLAPPASAPSSSDVASPAPGLRALYMPVEPQPRTQTKR